MLVKEIKLRHVKTRGLHQWFFKDIHGNEQLLLSGKFMLNRDYYIKFRNRGVVKCSDKYSKYKYFNKPSVRLEISSPLECDLDVFIDSVAIIMVDTKLKLAIQYRPLPNICKQDTFDISHTLINDLGLMTHKGD